MVWAGFGGPLLICLLKFTLNEKSLAHLLQFRRKYHVYSDSIQVQITEHTEYNYVMAALYYVGEELENLMRTNKQTDREQTERAITEATLIPWIARLSGSMYENSSEALWGWEKSCEQRVVHS